MKSNWTLHLYLKPFSSCVCQNIHISNTSPLFLQLETQNLPLTAQSSYAAVCLFPTLSQSTQNMGAWKNNCGGSGRTEPVNGGWGRRAGHADVSCCDFWSGSCSTTSVPYHQWACSGTHSVLLPGRDDLHSLPPRLGSESMIKHLLLPAPYTLHALDAGCPLLSNTSVIMLWLNTTLVFLVYI